MFFAYYERACIAQLIMRVSIANCEADYRFVIGGFSSFSSVVKSRGLVLAIL